MTYGASAAAPRGARPGPRHCIEGGSSSAGRISARPSARSAPSVMTFLSHWFRKAPPPEQAAAKRAPNTEGDRKTPPAPDAAERARTLAAEQAALGAAIEARDLPAVARCVVAGSTTQLRQTAAQAIEDLELLRQLLRETRGGKDSTVYKILSAKRDALLAQAREQEQLRAEIDHVAAALEQHSRRGCDIHFRSTLAQYEERWLAVSPKADAELLQRVQTAIERAQATLAEHQREAEAKAARELAAAADAAEAQRLREEQAQAAATAAAEQARLVSEEQRARAEQQQLEQGALSELSDLIRKARAALSGGSSARAAGLRRTIEVRRASAPPLTPLLTSQLQQLDQQLEALKDWKHFSVAPKRAELIQEMELLDGIALDPPALAERIKSLREEWRTLGKGAGETDEAEWQRFDAAAEKAYQPCKEYFAAQALIREQNLRRREALLTQLEAFEAAQDWERPDWRAVAKALHDTKEEWRRCSPVDHQAGKALQPRFADATARLKSRLDTEHARNVQQKESLIARAQALLSSDDARKATEAMKELQQQWRTVGLVPREADQRLWDTFRQLGDAVFQKRQQAAADLTAALDQRKAQAIALCEQVEKVAGLEGPELLEQTRELPALRAAFAALGELPKADTRPLHQRFDRAIERCEAALARQRAREAEQAWDDLFAAASQVQAYRLALARGLDTIDALKTAAESQIASLTLAQGRSGSDSTSTGRCAPHGSGSERSCTPAAVPARRDPHKHADAARGASPAPRVPVATLGAAHGPRGESRSDEP